MGEFRWLGRFEGGAAGAVLMVPLPPTPEPGSYLLVQEVGGTAAAFIGLNRPGFLEVNRQQAGAWQTPTLLPLPKATEPLHLMLQIATDYIVLALTGCPLGIYPLAAPANRISGLGGFGSFSLAKIRAGVPLKPSFASLSQREVADLPAMRKDVRRALVVAPYPVPAVADALGRCEEVVAVALTACHMAGLALAFSDQIAAGRLIPFAAVPFRPSGPPRIPVAPEEILTASDPEAIAGTAQTTTAQLEVKRFLSALEPIAELYCAPPSGSTSLESFLDPFWATKPKISFVTPLAEAAILLELGCRKASINRPWPIGCSRLRPERWNTAPVLGRLIRAAGDSRTDLVVVGSPGDAGP